MSEWIFFFLNGEIHWHTYFHVGHHFVRLSLSCHQKSHSCNELLSGKFNFLLPYYQYLCLLWPDKWYFFWRLRIGHDISCLSSIKIHCQVWLLREKRFWCWKLALSICVFSSRSFHLPGVIEYTDRFSTEG